MGELTTGTPKQSVEVTLSNGVKMTWETFLRTASQYLLGTKNRSENPHSQADTLDQMCEMIGVERKGRKK